MQSRNQQFLPEGEGHCDKNNSYLKATQHIIIWERPGHIILWTVDGQAPSLAPRWLWLMYVQLWLKF
jgi:hypothetical protein